MELSNQLLWTLDAVFLVPFLWVAVFLFGGGITGSGAKFSVGWPWCWVGLASMTWVILRVTEVIHA